jgi:hypothetical protein
VGFGGISFMNTISSIIFAVTVVYITNNSGTGEKKGEFIMPGLFIVASTPIILHHWITNQCPIF